MDIDALIEQIFEKHTPNPPANDQKIAQFEPESGFRLPQDVKHFYQRCNGAELFKERHYAPYILLPIQHVKRTRLYIFGQDGDKLAASSWYAICDMHEGNYVGIDLESKDGQTWLVLDCFHETHGIPGGNKVIAKSFTEFLKDALASKGEEFWLAESFQGYGDALTYWQSK